MVNSILIFNQLQKNNLINLKIIKLVINVTVDAMWMMENA